MTQTSGFLRKSFLIWVFVNFLGISAAAAIPWLFTTLMFPQNDIVSIFIFSVPISLAQWLALRRTSQTSILWVLTIPIGILVFTLIYKLLPDGLRQIFDDDSIVVLTVGYLLIGFLIGILQWLILRRKFSGSSLWILGSSVGIGFSFWLILATNLINQSGVLSFIVGVLVYSSVTGSILLRLLAQREQSRPA